MAISGKTTKLEWPYPLTGDKPPDGPAVFKAQAERAEAIFVGTAGQVLIDQSSGVPAPKTLKGDATLAEDGTLTLETAKSLYVAGENVRASAALGSFATPFKVTLPKVKAKQLVEILLFGWASASVESRDTGGGVTGAWYELLVGGVAVGAETHLASSAHDIAAGSFRQLASNPYSGLAVLYPAAGSANTETDYKIGEVQATVEKPGFGAISPFARSISYLVNVEATNLVVELVARSTTGSAKLTNGYLLARVVG